MDILREIGFVTNYIIQTFLSILKYSSWQIALIVIVIMFKRQFGMLISNMTNLKAGGFEASFGKELSNVERIVNRSNSAKFEKSVGNNYEYVDNANYRVINSFRLLENQLRRVFEKESGSKRFALMLDLRTDFSLPCKLIAEEHFLYDSIFTRI